MLMPNQAKPLHRLSSPAARHGVSPAGFFDDLWSGIKTGFSTVAGPAIDILGAPACELACDGNPSCVQACRAGAGAIRRLV